MTLSCFCYEMFPFKISPVTEDTSNKDLGVFAFDIAGFQIHVLRSFLINRIISN